MYVSFRDLYYSVQYMPPALLRRSVTFNLCSSTSVQYEIHWFTSFNQGTYLTRVPICHNALCINICFFYLFILFTLVRVCNHARNSSWNKAVPENEGKVSCAGQQPEALNQLCTNVQERRRYQIACTRVYLLT